MSSIALLCLLCLLLGRRHLLPQWAQEPPMVLPPWHGPAVAIPLGNPKPPAVVRLHLGIVCPASSQILE